MERSSRRLGWEEDGSVQQGTGQAVASLLGLPGPKAGSSLPSFKVRRGGARRTSGGIVPAASILQRRL